MVDACHAFVQPIKHTTLSVNLNVNYGLQLLMPANTGSPIVTDIPLWCEMLAVGEAVQKGEHGYFSALLSILMWTKTALKNNVYFKKIIFNLWQHVNTTEVMFVVNHCILEIDTRAFISKNFNNWDSLSDNQGTRSMSGVMGTKTLS